MSASGKERKKERKKKKKKKKTKKKKKERVPSLVYITTNKTKIVLIEIDLTCFLRGADALHVRGCA